MSAALHGWADRSASRYILCAFLLFLMTILVTFPLRSQTAQDDPNIYYAYDLGIGVGYKNLSPITETSYVYQSNEFTGTVRYPLPSFVYIAPVLTLGLLQMIVEEDDQEHEGKWDHNQLFGLIGAGYTSRFSKEFEFGADLLIGGGVSLFPDLFEAEVPVEGEDPVEPPLFGTVNFVAAATGRIALDPSYNLSINIVPSLRFSASFNSDFNHFNDLSFGIGIDIQYRFGDDPDVAPEIIRAIRFGEPDIDTLFAALQSWYVDNAIGSVEVTNIMTYPITDVAVTFFQPTYMDNPTVIAQFSELLPNDPQTIELTASFNKNVFDLINVTPLTGEIKIEYVARNTATEQTRSVDYELHDKTAMTWTDDRKVAAFITSRDSALVNFTDAVRRYTENYLNTGLNQNLQTAMQIYSGLNITGCTYQIDVISAFEQVQDDPLIVDVVNLPRTTLKRGYGDCDDLTVLYNSLLEAASIETGFITTPGHIYSVFNTEIPASDFRTLHPDNDLLLAIEGQLWVPVEITMLGTDDFLAAWRRGAEEWNAYRNDTGKRNFYRTRSAQQTYRPVGLLETDLGLQYGETNRIIDTFVDNRDRHVQDIIDSYADEARELDNKRAYNQLGIIAAQFEKYSQAEAAFTRSISLDRNYTSPQVNLGNVYLLQQRYFDAIETYSAAEKVLVDRNRTDSELHLRIVLGISRAYYELENYDKAIELYQYVDSRNADLAQEYSYLAQSPGTT